MVTLTRDRVEADIAPELDVHQAELNLYSTAAAIPALKTRLLQTINRIGVLLGEEPGRLRDQLLTFQEVPDPPQGVMVGLPVNLLRQRPDIRAAERALAARTALIGKEIAEFYPRFALFGSLTQESVGSAAFFESGSTAWSLVPGLRWNIFTAGRIEANVDIAEAEAEQALIAYQATVLLALEEVENALIGYQQEQARRDSLRRSVQAGVKSVELAQILYKTGVTNFQNVLDMQRRLAEQQDRLAESEGLVVQYLVSLYKALGGGWRPDQPVLPSEDGDEAKEKDAVAAAAN
jgi:NodT family efflux transporter outer membrane factor (OMF) lipoprotein